MWSGPSVGTTNNRRPAEVGSREGRKGGRSRQKDRRRDLFPSPWQSPHYVSQLPRSPLTGRDPVCRSSIVPAPGRDRESRILVFLPSLRRRQVDESHFDVPTTHPVLDGVRRLSGPTLSKSLVRGRRRTSPQGLGPHLPLGPCHRLVLLPTTLGRVRGEVVRRCFYRCLPLARELRVEETVAVVRRR